jgi:serine/threonine protein kinase
VAYLHEVGIVHRDIKPENILICEDRTGLPTIKLIDFGLSRFISPDDLCTVPCGTLAYAAPEILRNERYHQPVDIFSCGVVLYLLLRGHLPFDSKDKQEIIDMTLHSDADMTGEIWDSISTAAKNLIKRMLTKDPAERISLKDALRHAWFANIERTESIMTKMYDDEIYF